VLEKFQLEKELLDKIKSQKWYIMAIMRTHDSLEKQVARWLKDAQKAEEEVGNGSV